MLAAIVVAAALAAIAPSQPADHGRPPVTQQQTVKAEQPDVSNNAPAHNPGSSPASRLYVEAACEHGCGYSENNESWLHKLGTDPVATFTAVLALLTAGLIGVGVVQGFLINSQIQLGRDEFNATHRPEIVVHSAMEATAVMRESRTAIGASFTYFNKGTTKATNVKICALIVPVVYGNPPQERIAMPFVRDQPTEPIMPGTPYFFAVWSDVEHHRAQNRSDPMNPDGLLPPEATVYCIGTISYEDAAGVRRQTGFCWRWQPNRIWQNEYTSAYSYAY